MSPHAEFYEAVMMIVCGGAMLFADPNKSRLRKWIYWCFAPLIGIVCAGLAFNSIVGAFGIGAMLVSLFIFGYFRYWLSS
jgi:hypothetical protein